MQAAVLREKKILVAEAPIPEPAKGEVLAKTLACGICGTDLHVVKHTEMMIEVSR